jgi:UPF0755 protein
MAERKQQKVKQRRGFVDIINALLTLIVLGVIVAGGVGVYGAHNFYSAGPISQDTDFNVSKGDNLGKVGENLYGKGLIDNPYVFQIGGFALKKQGQLKVGEYRLPAGASMFDILKDLTEGRPLSLDVTIPEGFTSAQVVDRLTKTDKLTGSIAAQPAEGSVLPDTYAFDPGATRQSVLDRMQAAMKAKLDDVWQSRNQDVPLTSPEQLVTIASIIEKETPVPAERAEIAAVYYNRLVKHMRLQSDPTVVYGITQGVNASGRLLTRSELAKSTPYNTYQVDGLPPTPISNPGADALTAAANPARSNNIYFVAISMNPKDGHLFAATYTDHRKNVAKLRLVEKQQAAADADADDNAAKDQLEQQQAAAAGDPTAPGSAPSPPADVTAAPAAPAATSPADDSPAAQPAAPAPSDHPDASAVTPDQAPAAPQAAGPSVSTDPNVPVPMPADQRPADTGSDASPPAANTTDVAPAAPAAAAPAPVKPKPAKPKPKPAQTDVFGG